MIPEHTLLLKNDFFILTKHHTRSSRYYEVSIATKKLVYAKSTELAEIADFFGTGIRKYAWRFPTEEEARSKITWATMKWSV